jgi:hypothetical protein
VNPYRTLRSVVRFSPVETDLIERRLTPAGERGVDRVLEWLRSDLVRTMSLLGAATVADLDRELLA